MLTPEGVLKLIDFGVARTYKARKSKDTVAMGSAGYAPPEQYGKGQTDARSDVYALGATLLHLLTNMPPIPLQTPSRRRASASSTLRWMRRPSGVIIKAMALDPDLRYQQRRRVRAGAAAPPRRAICRPNRPRHTAAAGRRRQL